MSNVEPHQATKIIVPFFLQSLMKIERENQELTTKQASAQSNWSSKTWEDVEKGSRVLQPQHWQVAATVLCLNANALVRRLNAFISKNPLLWLEKQTDNTITICKRSITSPRAVRSSNIFSVELGAIRPNLYNELASYWSQPREIIEISDDLGYFSPQSLQPLPSISPSGLDLKTDTEVLKDRILAIIDTLPKEKIALLERVADKFNRFPAKKLALAYKHFSISVKD